MTFGTLLRAAVTAALFCLLIQEVRADLKITGAAQATAAYIEFCRRDPTECEPAANQATRALNTNELWRIANRINTQVNKAVRLETDQDHWGLEDRWDYPIDGRGDCEDLALEKRRRLIKAGVAPRALLFAVVLFPNGEGHLVLVLRTDRGELVLDTRSNDIMVAEDTGYTWIKRQSTEHPLSWVAYQ